MTRRPPSHFRKRLHEIHPDLDVEWWGDLDTGRWAIVQRLPHAPSVMRMLEVEVQAAQARMSALGYTISREDCARRLLPIIMRQNLVFVVQEPNGAYRDLDERTFAELRERAYRVRHWDADDWEAHSNGMQDEAKRARDRAQNDLFDGNKDKIFTQMVQDKLWGLNMKYHHGGPLPAGADKTPLQPDTQPTGA